MTTLVTIGCSHTAGAMLDGRNGTSWKNKELSFGGLLAKKYNMSHYCLGVPGGSNEYIYKSTIKFINNFMHDHDDYIFLLGINNLFSTIMLILDNYKIEDYLVGIEGSYCIIKEKLNNYGGNVLRLFLEDEEFFYNLISTSKNNVYKYFLCLKNNFSKSEILFSINSNKLYVYQNIQRQNQEYLNNLIT